MIKYDYKAKDAAGKNKAGYLMAENLADFYMKLKNEGLYCTGVEESRNQGDIIDVFAPKKGGKKLKLDNVAIFCRQFATMLSSGITVIKCLDILYHQSETKLMKSVLLNTYESIKKGNSLSNAMNEQGNAFPSLLISMIQSGEASGSLDDVMLSMSIHFEKEKALRNKIKSAMIYPIVLISVSVVVVAILLIKVVPTFMEMFGSEDNLPATTKVLLGISDAMKNYWWAILLACGGIAFLVKLLLKNAQFRYAYDRMKTKIPKFGKLMMVVLTARFSRTVSTLYSSGVSIIDSIRIASSVLGNAYIATKLENAIDEIKKGVTFSQALISTGAFPSMFTSMVYIGEESGSLDSILNKTADFYDEDASTAIGKMVALLEPCLIIILGLIVAFIVISVAEPMFGMYDHIA